MLHLAGWVKYTHITPFWQFDLTIQLQRNYSAPLPCLRTGARSIAPSTNANFEMTKDFAARAHF